MATAETDMEANRQGRLTDAQKASLKAGALRRGRHTAIGLCLFFTFFIVTGTITNTHSVVKASVIIAALELLFVGSTLSLNRKVRRLVLAEIDEGKVASLTGKLEGRHRSRYARTYYLTFAGKTLFADVGQIDPVRTTLEQVSHHVYYLPRSQRVLGFEPA